MRTTDEVISSVRSEDSSYSGKRKAFLDKYLTYENACSSEKIFEEVFVKGSAVKTVRARAVLVKAVRKLLPKRSFGYLRRRLIKKHL